MKRISALAVLGVGCAIAGISFASGGGKHGLDPRALAFMRSVTIPDTGAPPAVRNAFAERRHAGTPRKAGELGSGRGRLVLWVSPRSSRGWCFAMQGPGYRLGAQCIWWRASAGPFSGGYVGPELFSGRAPVLPGRELRLRFEDGSSIHIPTNDGFYFYRVPDERLIRAQPSALVLREHGKAIARFRLSDLYGDFPLAPGAAATHRPGGADFSRARPVLAVTTRAGGATLFVAPSKLRPATCWWLWIHKGTYGGGCARNDRDHTTMWRVGPLRALVRGHELWVLWGRAGSRFASLELRYQDGRRMALVRKRGFFLHVVRGADRARGHRPALLVGRDRDGRVLRKQLLLTFAWAPS